MKQSLTRLHDATATQLIVAVQAHEQCATGALATEVWTE